MYLFFFKWDPHTDRDLYKMVVIAEDETAARKIVEKEWGEDEHQEYELVSSARIETSVVAKWERFDGEEELSFPLMDIHDHD